MGGRRMIPDTALCAHMAGELECMRYGHIVLQCRGDRLWVLQAEPRILLTGELLDRLAGGTRHPDVELAMPDDADEFEPNGYAGAVLTVRAANQTVVYRVARQHGCPSGPADPELFARDLWLAQWPD